MWLGKWVPTFRGNRLHEIGAAGFPETLVSIHLTNWRHVLENSSLDAHSRVKVKSQLTIAVLVKSLYVSRSCRSSTPDTEIHACSELDSETVNQFAAFLESERS